MGSGRRLEILVFGAGAIGSYVGGSLAMRGHRAVFVERPDAAAAIERAGLRLRTASGAALAVPRSAYRVVASLSDGLSAGPFDVALVALKSFDVASLIAGLEACPDGFPDLPLLCLSNGVDNETALARAFGAGRVIAGTVTTAVARGEAGDVRVERLRGTGVAATHPLSARLAEAMSEAGLNTRLYPRAADMKWSKLLTNLLANATSAILDLTPAEIFAHPGLYRLEVAQLREALRVMKALDAKVVDLPRVPARLLALATGWPLALSRPLLARAVGGGRGAKMPSLHIDLRSGRRESEVEYLHGAVVRHGEERGVPAPVNRLLTATLLALLRGEVPLDSYARRPDALIEAAREGSRLI